MTPKFVQVFHSASILITNFTGFPLISNPGKLKHRERDLNVQCIKQTLSVLFVSAFFDHVFSFSQNKEISRKCLSVPIYTKLLWLWKLRESLWLQYGFLSIIQTTITTRNLTATTPLQ